MRRNYPLRILAVLLSSIAFAGCPAAKDGGGGATTNGNGKDGGKTTGTSDTIPVFSLAWSEYPSWSVFGVADEYGLINGKKGQRSTLEMKYNIDIELKEASYEACLNYYSTDNCDAVCVTNMDALNPALSRASVAIMPTSTSFGADALVVAGISDLDELAKHKAYGLKGTVSEYCFVRNLELAGKNPADYSFENMDPAAAAVAMQQKNPEQKAIMVWNPFVLQTLDQRKDSTVLFDSEKIPGEIVDMIVMAEKSLAKPGGKQFVMCLMDTFYQFNRDYLNDPQKRDKALVDLGKKFSNLDVKQMAKCTEQTKFYKTPEEAAALFTSDEFKQTMEKVTKFCLDQKILNQPPKVGYGNAETAKGTNLRFDASYLQEFQQAKK